MNSLSELAVLMHLKNDFVLMSNRHTVLRVKAKLRSRLPLFQTTPINFRKGQS
ncbi:MAG: hypothetical protein ACJAYN_000505 [Bermanella sp.]|jgi:hypothetical protein